MHEIGLELITRRSQVRILAPLLKAPKRALFHFLANDLGLELITPRSLVRILVPHLRFYPLVVSSMDEGFQP